MTEIQVVIDNAVNLKLQHWIRKAPGEVSGLGKVVIEGGVFRVVEAVLIKQENTSASTDMDPAAVGRTMYELRDTPGLLNFWWHSHSNMDVFWSGTDIDTIRQIGQHGFLISTVFNKRGEKRSALYIRAQNGLPEIFLDQVNTQVLQYLNPDSITAWDKEYDEKCAPKQWPKWEGPSYSDPYDGKYENEGYRNNSGSSERSPQFWELTSLEEIFDLLDSMECEPNYIKAKGMLHQACRAISLMKELPEDLIIARRKSFCQRFEESRPGYQGRHQGLIEDQRSQPQEVQNELTQ